MRFSVGTFSVRCAFFHGRSFRALFRRRRFFRALFGRGYFHGLPGSDFLRGLLCKRFSVHYFLCAFFSTLFFPVLLCIAFFSIRFRRGFPYAPLRGLLPCALRPGLIPWASSQGSFCALFLRCSFRSVCHEVFSVRSFVVAFDVRFLVRAFPCSLLQGLFPCTLLRRLFPSLFSLLFFYAVFPWDDFSVRFSCGGFSLRHFGGAFSLYFLAGALPCALLQVLFPFALLRGFFHALFCGGLSVHSIARVYSCATSGRGSLFSRLIRKCFIPELFCSRFLPVFFQQRFFLCALSQWLFLRNFCCRFSVRIFE